MAGVPDARKMGGLWQLEIFLRLVFRPGMKQESRVDDTTPQPNAASLVVIFEHQRPRTETDGQLSLCSIS